MNSRTTLKKISGTLGLSISTVSRALKDHPDISEETKKKVRELAGQLDYEPNTYAINLRTNSSRVFGLIVPAISNFFYESFIAAAEKFSRERGYTLMILQSADDPQQEAANLKLCRANRVAGILISIVPDSQPSSFKSLEEAGIPVLFFDKVPEGDHFNKVCLADEEAARMAANFILRYKRKNVLALFGNPTLSITQKRLKGFEQEFRGTGHSPALIIQYCKSSEEAERATRNSLLSKEIDQVFAMSDEILIGVMKALHGTGKKIPEEVAVLAMSNGFLPPLYNPVITYVETSGYALGELAMKRMMEYLGGQTFYRSVELPSVLVPGGSM